MIEWEKLSNFAVWIRKDHGLSPPPSPVEREPEGKRQIRSNTVVKPLWIRCKSVSYIGHKKLEKSFRAHDLYVSLHY